MSILQSISDTFFNKTKPSPVIAVAPITEPKKETRSLGFELFDTKEEYRAFRKAFAKAVRDKRAKRYFEPCDEWITVMKEGKHGTYETYEISKGTGNARRNGWMTSAHFVLLNLVRGKPVYHGFTVKKNRRALISGYYPWYGLHWALYLLKRVCKPGNSEWMLERQKEFLEPLEGTITPEMLSDMYSKVPEAPLYGYYHIDDIVEGKVSGKEVYEKVLRYD